MLSKMIRFFWPDLSDWEIKKYGLLTLAFFFVIGAYWLLKPIKDGIFFNIVGIYYQPLAKVLSVVTILVLVFVYTRLVDIFEKQQLFYIIGTFYIFVFAIVAYLIGLPTSGAGAISPKLLKGVGWATYLFVESFGSIIGALFWSFTASVSDPLSAKKCYPMIIAGAQIGGVLGPFVAWKYAEVLGMRFLSGLVSFLILMLICTIFLFMKIIPKNEIEVTPEQVYSKSQKPRFFEGIILVFKRPYLLGILAIVSFYEIVNTIIDFQMKWQAQAIYTTKESLTSFVGLFGVASNSLALIVAFLGTSYLMKRYGLRFCLLAFPISLAIVISILLFCAKFIGLNAFTLLWITFFVMVVTRGLNYALNNPTKEMMYVPTSREVKFKSKGWIDMFGSRFAKAEGSVFNNFLKGSSSLLMYAGSLISLGFIGLWVLVAIFVSGKFKKLVHSGEIIE